MPKAVPCIGYASQSDAITALALEGLSNRDIAARTGLHVDRVDKTLSALRKRGSLPRVAPRRSEWSAEKLAKARRLYDLTMAEIAKALAVTVEDLLLAIAPAAPAIRETPEPADQAETRIQEGPLPGSPGDQGVMAGDRRAGAPPGTRRPDDTANGNKSAPAIGPMREGDGVTDAGKPVAQAAIPDAQCDVDRDIEEQELIELGAAGQDSQGEVAGFLTAPRASTSAAGPECEAGPQPVSGATNSGAAITESVPGPDLPGPPLYRMKRRGEYLDRSGVGFTRNLRRAWQGTAQQTETIYRRRPEYRDLDVEQVFS